MVHRRRINVDFPLPLPPIRTERPGGNVTDTSLTASVVPVRDLKVLLKELVRIKELPSYLSAGPGVISTQRVSCAAGHPAVVASRSLACPKSSNYLIVYAPDRTNEWVRCERNILTPKKYRGETPPSENYWCKKYSMGYYSATIVRILTICPRPVVC